MAASLDGQGLEVADLGHAEHCRLPEDVLEALGLAVGHQVRLRRGAECALFTVAGTAPAVQVDPAGRERLGTDGPVAVEPDLFAAEDGPVVGTFEEALVEGGDGLVAVAPHGGEIEALTDGQAERLAERVGGTAWVCRGTWTGWGAFDRWHVTANDVHPASFPGLARIADRGFDRAVAFHAWLQSGIGVGGAAPRPVRVAVRDAIADALGDDVDVFLVDDPAYRGDRPENVVNWLTADGASGIQLEQEGPARVEFGDAIVDAVADALGTGR